MLRLQEEKLHTNKCAYAHAKKTSRPNTAGTEPTNPCRLFALGTCRLGDSCNDQHGNPGKGKSKGKGNGKGRDATSASPAAAAAAIIVCESVNDRRHAYRAPVGVALAASVNFDNDLDYYDDADDMLPSRTCYHVLWTHDASTT